MGRRRNRLRFSSCHFLKWVKCTSYNITMKKLLKLFWTKQGFRGKYKLCPFKDNFSVTDAFWKIEMNLHGGAQKVVKSRKPRTRYKDRILLILVFTIAVLWDPLGQVCVIVIFLLRCRFEDACQHFDYLEIWKFGIIMQVIVQINCH